MNDPPQQVASDQEWSIWIANKKVTGNTLNAVRGHIQTSEMSKWLAAPRKNGRAPRLSALRQRLINSTAIEHAWKHIMHGQRKWLTKMNQRFAPVGKNMHRWGFWTNSRCPGCHQENEDEVHLFKCPHHICRQARIDAIKVLRQRLQTFKTEPLLLNMIILNVQEHTGLGQSLDNDTEDANLRLALHHQNIIGWHNFLLGQVAEQFEQCQHEFILETRQWNNSAFWAKNLTLALWEFGWAIWKTRNEILHDSKGVERIPTRQLNASITEEWQNGIDKLLDQDKALIRGTTLPHLLQTKQEHKVTWLAQIRRARMAYATITDADSSTTTDDATEDPNNGIDDDSQEEEEQ